VELKPEYSRVLGLIKGMIEMNRTNLELKHVPPTSQASLSDEQAGSLRPQGGRLILSRLLRLLRGRAGEWS
jgi:hypothetical protein